MTCTGDKLIRPRTRHEARGTVSIGLRSEHVDWTLVSGGKTAYATDRRKPTSGTIDRTQNGGPLNVSLVRRFRDIIEFHCYTISYFPLYVPIPSRPFLSLPSVPRLTSIFIYFTCPVKLTLRSRPSSPTISVRCFFWFIPPISLTLLISPPLLDHSVVIDFSPNAHQTISIPSLSFSRPRPLLLNFLLSVFVTGLALSREHERTRTHVYREHVCETK